MAEIIPDSTITLLFDVPLQNNYENTFYFISRNEQRNWFFNYYRKVEFNQQSYQRKNKGWLRLSARYRDVYNANYMYFMNNWRTQTPSVPEMVYEQKDFYAFITQVDYINDMTVEIHYEIDVLQTYMFDWQFQDTFIERETVESDNLGEHIIDEGLPIGDYVNNKISELYFNTTAGQQSLTTKYFLVAATFNYDAVTDTFTDLSDGDPTNQIVSGMPVGCKYFTFNSAQATIDFLNKIPGEKISGVLSVNVIPFLAAQAITLSQGYGNWSANIDKSQFFSENHSLDGYIPENNKLQCYPYNFMLIESGDGNSREFAYEHFKSGTILFLLNMICSLPIQGMLFPAEYKTVQSNDPVLAISYALYLPPTATCTFSTDTFKAWYALNSGFITTERISAISDLVIDNASAILGAARASLSSTGDMYLSELGSARGITGDYQRLANTYYTVRNAKRAPDAINGSANNQLIMMNNQYKFMHVNRCIRSDYAKSLDKYFKMFGYKVNTVKHPYLTNRTRFTYLKTVNMDIGGEIPQDDKNKICEIFNKGVRWWLDIATIGDYTSPNPVRSA